jgi:hypothetical protein
MWENHCTAEIAEAAEKANPKMAKGARVPLDSTWLRSASLRAGSSRLFSHSG